MTRDEYISIFNQSLRAVTASCSSSLGVPVEAKTTALYISTDSFTFLIDINGIPIVAVSKWNEEISNASFISRADEQLITATVRAWAFGYREGTADQIRRHTNDV